MVVIPPLDRIEIFQRGDLLRGCSSVAEELVLRFIRLGVVLSEQVTSSTTSSGVLLEY